jgi:hypothetical protein
MVKGKNYVEADEKFDKKSLKKDAKGMKSAGIANKLKSAEKEEGYSKKPKVKGQKKMGKIDLKKGQVY